MLIFAVARFAKILRGRFIDDTLTFVSGHSVDFVSILQVECCQTRKGRWRSVLLRNYKANKCYVNII
jgi:hypothetical protein